MKVKDLTNKMADFGTKPRVKIFKNMEDCNLLVYEGNPHGEIFEETKNLKVNSFAVLGVGFIEIYAESK